MNCILFSAPFGGCVDCKNMRGMNKIKIVTKSVLAFLTAGFRHSLVTEL